MTQVNEAISSADREFVLTREFDVSRDLMFKVWTEPDRLMQWWGPKGLKLVACHVDASPGGVFHYGMQTLDGNTMWGKWVFTEVAAPERFVFVSSFSDENRGVTRHPLAADWPLETLSTVAFEEHDGRTTVTMRAVPVNATDAERKRFEESFESMQQGWKGTLEQLNDYLARL